MEIDLKVHSSTNEMCRPGIQGLLKFMRNVYYEKHTMLNVLQDR